MPYTRPVFCRPQKLNVPVEYFNPYPVMCRLHPSRDHLAQENWRGGLIIARQWLGLAFAANSRIPPGGIEFDSGPARDQDLQSFNERKPVSRSPGPCLESIALGAGPMGFCFQKLAGRSKRTELKDRGQSTVGAKPAAGDEFSKKRTTRLKSMRPTVETA